MVRLPAIDTTDAGVLYAPPLIPRRLIILDGVLEDAKERRPDENNYRSSGG